MTLLIMVFCEELNLPQRMRKDKRIPKKCGNHARQGVAAAWDAKRAE
jgi:hypothetical protein